MFILVLDKPNDTCNKLRTFILPNTINGNYPPTVESSSLTSKQEIQLKAHTWLQWWIWLPKQRIL